MLSFQEAIELPSLPHGTYNMRVDRTAYVKNFYSKNAGCTMFRNDIYFVDDNEGTCYRGEYLTRQQEQNDFKIGEVCCFRVDNPNMREISKCSEQTSTGHHTPGNSSMSFGPDGKNAIVSLSYAKDLAVARIRAGQMTGEEPDFLDRIFSEAERMCNWLLNPVSNSPF